MSKKQQIKKFVFSRISKNELEKHIEIRNGEVFEDCLGFGSYNDFRKKNEEIIKALSKKEVNWLLILIDNITIKKMSNMDKDDMIDFTSSGFCWNNDGKLVIFNEK